MTTFYDTRKFSLTSRRNFSKWQLFTKTCSFYRFGFGGHSAPNRPISDQHRINQSAISTESTNQRSAFSHHFLTFDLMIFFFFTQVQTPVTLYGELWSILVVRLAHSANLRSRFGHVSAAQGVPGWSPIQVLTPLDGAWLRWSDGNRYVTATWL